VKYKDPYSTSLSWLMIILEISSKVTPGTLISFFSNGPSRYISLYSLINLGFSKILAIIIPGDRESVFLSCLFGTSVKLKKQAGGVLLGIAL